MASSKKSRWDFLSATTAAPLLATLAGCGAPAPPGAGNRPRNIVFILTDDPRPYWDHWSGFAGQREYFNPTFNINGRRVRTARYEYMDYHGIFNNNEIYDRPGEHT
jgi:hypothetical protein